MGMAFVVMQIGNPEMDHLFEAVIQPAIESMGLQAKRVDRDNEGGLLKNEIIHFLNNSEIIVADLTNERPNVYLEVGYAMGIDKFRNLILTCRSDHLPGNADWRPDGPKIHFDLAGYDILFWESSKPDSFRQKLGDYIHGLTTNQRSAFSLGWRIGFSGRYRSTAAATCSGVAPL